MKKIFALILALVMALSLAACGGNKDNTVADGNTEPTGNTTGTVNNSTESTQGTTEDTTETNPPETTSPNTPSATHTHIYAHTVIAPTCTADGYTTHKCSCGYNYVSDITQSVGHQFGEWQTTKQPTTTETGVAERKCANCTTQETKTLGKIIANHTHSYTSDVIQEASCTKEGIKRFACTCGEYYTERIAKTSHNYTADVFTPTCTKDGYTKYICHTLFCGHTYTVPIAAKGHSWSSWSTEVAAEVGKAGLERRSCSTCKTSETRSIPALQEDTTKTWFVNEYNKAKQQYINSLSSSVSSKNSEIATLREQASACYVAYVNETKRIKNQCANMGMSNSGYEASLLKNAEDNYKAQARIYTNKIQQLEDEINTVESEKTNPSVDSILEIVAKNNSISSIETYEYYNKYSDSIS